MSSRKDELVALLAGMSKEDKKILLAELAKELVAKNGPVQHHFIFDDTGRKIGYFVPPAAWIEFPLPQDYELAKAEYKKKEGPVITSEQFFAEIKEEYPELAAEIDQMSFSPPPFPEAKAG